MADDRGVQMYECYICHQHARKTLSAVLRHIREVHPYFESPVTCGLNGCAATPSSFDALKKHLYRYHRDLLNIEDDNCAVIVNTDEREENGACDAMDGEDDGDELAEATVSPLSASMLGAQFIMKIRDGKKLTQTTTNEILSDVRIVVENTVETLKQKVLHKVNEWQVLTDEETSELKAIFSDERTLNPFKDLGTLYRQEKFIQENFNYVAPQQLVLGRYYQSVGGEMKEISDCCYYVPLLESLQSLLQMRCVRDQVFNSHKLSSGKIGDYCDAEQFQQHPLFQEDPCALQIKIYYDDLEVTNALGSKISKHKLGVLYYTLGNIDPKFRSLVHTIQLLMVIKTPLIKKYGINAVLKPFMEEICQLESDSGVPITIDGIEMNFRGTLTICSADNPAACTMGGFKALHSALRKCRSCMAVDSDMQTKFTENELQLRTCSAHTSYISDLDGPLRDHIATTYGVTEQSVLNDSRYFHVVSGLVPDVMHDVLEGTTQFTLKCLLQHLIGRKYFSRDDLNRRIVSFDYGQVEVSNKPSQISKSTYEAKSYGLKQSASQAWCLARFFPLLVGDLVPQDDKKWLNFLKLLTIMEYVLAPVTTMDKITYLEHLIAVFLTEFVQLYPGKPLVPKMHYLVHIPMWTKRCGPLVSSWCMRYEAKNKYFKEIATTIGNFKNIGISVSSRHQRYMCYKMTCPDNFLGGKTTYGVVKSVIVSDLDYCDQLLDKQRELLPDDEIQRVSFVEKFGTRYCIGSVVFCAIDDHTPLFGKIKDILVLPSQNCLFTLVPYEGTYFCSHFNAYELHCMDFNYLLYSQEDLIDHRTLSISKSFSRLLSHKRYLCLKYHVFM